MNRIAEAYDMSGEKKIWIICRLSDLRNHLDSQLHASVTAINTLSNLLNHSCLTIHNKNKSFEKYVQEDCL